MAAAMTATHRRTLRVDCSIKSHPWHATLQGEVVSEGSIWAGVPAKPLGHRAAAEYRRAIDDLWAIRPAKLEEIPGYAPVDGANDPGTELSAPDDVVLNIDTSHDVSACDPLCAASPVSRTAPAIPCHPHQLGHLSLGLVSQAERGSLQNTKCSRCPPVPGTTVRSSAERLARWRRSYGMSKGVRQRGTLKIGHHQS